jgi:hypothetical protein
MTAIQTKRFQWISTPSFWQVNATQRARSQSMRADVEATMSSAADSFAGASADLATGMATIAAKRAAIRLHVPGVGASVNKSA